MTNFAALRQRLPLLRRERQNYASGTLIALVRSLIVKKNTIFFSSSDISYLTAAQWFVGYLIVTFDLDLHLNDHISFHHQVCNLPAVELAANDKSRRAIALQHQLIPRYMANWKVTFSYSYKFLHGQLEGYYFLLIQVLQKLDDLF